MTTIANALLFTYTARPQHVHLVQMPNFDLESVLEGTVSPELIAASTERIDYEVHLKYVKRIGFLSNGLSISHSLKPVITADTLKGLDSKLRIIERTNKLFEQEAQSINDDAEYAHVCVGWLPAQVYYNLYHLLSIIEYIVTGQIGRASCRERV